MVQEFVAAKDEAVAAKAAGDRARQQAAGKVIRDLKEQMAALGATPF